MRYTINARVIYDAADNTLTLPECNEPDSQLSIMAGALLYYFLRHTEVVSRDEVLKKVWDDNGLTSSNGNLNQYLSMLRKTLRLRAQTREGAETEFLMQKKPRYVLHFACLNPFADAENLLD